MLRTGRAHEKEPKGHRTHGNHENHGARGAKVAFVALALLCMTLGTTAIADPPAKSTFNIPAVVCFRVTDVQEIAPNRFEFMIQFANWANVPTHGIAFDFADHVNADPSLDPVPELLGGSIDVNGRPFGPVDDDANYSPSDGNVLPVKSIAFGGPGGRMNDWVETTNSVCEDDLGNLEPCDQLWCTDSASGTVFGTPVPPRDLINSGSTTAACALIPGCSGGTVNDLETVDNGLGPDNVMDGFVLDIAGLDPGEHVSFNWFLLNEDKEPMGVSSGLGNCAANGNEFGFGTFTIYRQIASEDGGPIWGCQAGDCPGSNTGTRSDAGLWFDNSATLAAGGVATFQSEIGLSITAPFRNPANNRFNAPVNAAALSSIASPVPSMSAFGLIVTNGILVLSGAIQLVRRRGEGG